MSDVVIVALCSLVGTLGGSIIGAIVSSKVTDLRLQMLEAQVKELAKKQDDYISLDKRLLIIETKLHESED